MTGFYGEEFPKRSYRYQIRGQQLAKGWRKLVLFGLLSQGFGVGFHFIEPRFSLFAQVAFSSGLATSQ